jgi:hypothetical protein
MRLPPARPLCRESERSLVRRRVLHAARRRNSSVFQGLGLAKPEVLQTSTPSNARSHKLCAIRYLRTRRRFRARSLGTFASTCLSRRNERCSFPRNFWRRRPDLNRGWRFCRQGRDVYVVDSSCFVVGPTPPLSPVFGRNCSHIVPRFLDGDYSPDRVPKVPNGIGCLRRVRCTATSSSFRPERL